MAEALLGEIRIFAGPFAPEGWRDCDGQLLSVQQYQALYSIIGDIYEGGDGVKTFALPDLRGRVAVGSGTGMGLTPCRQGKTGGVEVSSSANTAFSIPVPQHTHELTYTAPTVSVQAGSPGTAPSLKIAVASINGQNGLGPDGNVLAMGHVSSTPAPSYAAPSAATGHLGGVNFDAGTFPSTPTVTLSGGGAQVKPTGVPDATGTVSVKTDVRQPFLGMRYIICVDGGEYPVRPND